MTGLRLLGLGGLGVGLLRDPGGGPRRPAVKIPLLDRADPNLPGVTPGDTPWLLERPMGDRLTSIRSPSYLPMSLDLPRAPITLSPTRSEENSEPAEKELVSLSGVSATWVLEGEPEAERLPPTSRNNGTLPLRPRGRM